MPINKSLKEVVELVESEGYQLDKRPNKLNIVGIRDAQDTTALTFDDQLAAFYYDDNGNLLGITGAGTTSPSKYWLENPMNSMGTAILKGGQYKDSWQIGSHRGKYEALTQAKPVTVIRDDDRNALLDFFAPTTTGMYGINIHRASRGKADEAIIGADSAGCQVWKKEADFDEMMRLARISRDKYGNQFTYTLIDNRDIIRRRVNYALIGGIIIGITAYSYFIFRKKI